MGSFLEKSEPDSAITAELRPEIAEWSTVFKTNVILADIYDALACLASIVASKGTKRKPQKPKEYPRSWRKQKKQFKKTMKGREWLKLLGGGGENG